ncbi:MAG: hypothetical protein ACR2PO_14505 [Methyloligellaceae bacterium]
MKLLRGFKLGKGGRESGEREWMCGRLQSGKACRIGPTNRGRCQATFECVPVQSDGTWRCRRPASNGGQCQEGPHPDGTCCNPIPACSPVRTVRAKREVLAKWLAILVVGVVALTITYAGDTKLFMPGPITTAHSSIGECSGCHSNIADGQFGWLHALVAYARPDEDTAACLTCHKMGPAAMNPHGIGLESLEVSTERLQAVAAASPAPTAARIRNAVFPARGTLSEGVFCATCHKEHQGKTFDLTTMANARCQSCHMVQFTSFHKDHPKFNNYPFRRRTRINFDHRSHFGEHFPETLKKEPQSKTVPGACADCHKTGPDKRHMGVKPFAQICSACHLKQIVGTERATGPKGIALLTLPGIDVATLKEKNATIGEWPELSEAEVTPLMKLLIGGDDEGKRLLARIGALDLLDLSEASDADVAAVEAFVWRVKELIHGLSTAKAPELMKRLGSVTDEQLEPDLIAKLTASMPRDVLIAAQSEWLPNLAAEIAAPRPTRAIPAAPPEGGAEVSLAKRDDAAEPPTARAAVSDNRGQETEAEPSRAEAAESSSEDNAEAEKDDEPQQNETVVPSGSGQLRISVFGDIVRGSKDLTGKKKSEDDEAETSADDEPADDKTETAKADEEKPEEPTETANTSAPQAVDAETWAEFGGWYRQDFAILYKPTGHADGFLRAWLNFTARLYGKSNAKLASTVFDELTGKDAQGQCTKCHSVDAGKRYGRTMNWAPSSLATRASLFTSFAHEPHFGLVSKQRGCLTCHDLSGATGYQKTYKAHDPKVFVSNFKPVEQKQCAKCHNKNAAREDCLLCHKYHVTDVTTPILATKIPDK